MSLRGELLSVRVKELLLEQIQSGRWRPGDQLPAETELAEGLGVSRLTLRAGLMALERDGILIRKQGRGTFVAKNAQMLRTRIGDLLPINEVISSNGFVPRVNAAQQSWVPAPPWVDRVMGMSPDSRVLEVRRVYLADETPAILVVDYLPETLLGNLRAVPGFDGNMLAFMDRHLPVRVDHAVATIKAVQPSRDVQRLLRTNPSEPVLCMEQVACDERGEALWCSLSYHRSDLISFQAVRKRT